jgi:F0F1-type ATP synthase assembly protein I
METRRSAASPPRRSDASPRPGSRSTAADAAKAGALMLAVNGLCAGVGAAVGVLLGPIVPLALAGFFIGFGAAIAVVIRRYSER